MLGETSTVRIDGSLSSCPGAERPEGRGEKESSRSRRFLSRDGESI